MFNGKTVLITGGTGSFGNAVTKIFLEKTSIKEIRIFSRDEKKQDDMRHAFQDKRLKFYIGDVRDYNGVNDAIRGVDFVFHAAALKQVPSCEFYPIEAAKTNILGTENVVSAALANGIKKLVCLSTDKAVYPINAMGMSKALMEKVVIAKSRTSNHSTVFCCTRYGNVMASRGSVIPLFIDQAKLNNPLTITDPTMTRFMMTLDDAVQLVLFAFENGEQGDLFVQKAPAATVSQIAHSIKKLFNSKSEIKVIGTRHGEKKHETLLSREELLIAQDLKRYYRVPADVRDLNYNLYFSEGKKALNEEANYSSDNTYQLSDDEVYTMLENLDYVKRELDPKSRGGNLK